VIINQNPNSKPSEVKVTNRIKVIGTLHEYHVGELKDKMAVLFSLSRINPKSKHLKKIDY